MGKAKEIFCKYIAPSEINLGVVKYTDVQERLGCKVSKENREDGCHIPSLPKEEARPN
jgi:hypothetical protein